MLVLFALPEEGAPSLSPEWDVGMSLVDPAM